jgi:glutathione synthase/RimK-type ligase-like ATP-grasp enzyme
MVTVGMLHFRKHPQKVKKAYACAAVAKMEGIEFVYFSPGNVKFEEKMINGYIFEKGKWIQRKMMFPDVIYNPTSLKTVKGKKVYRKLKKIIPFTSHPIGNKLKVYRKIKEMDEFSNYLIQSAKIKEPQTVFNALYEYNKIVIKPLSGNNGKNVIFIERDRDQDQFNLIIGIKQSKVDEAELISIIEDHIKEKIFLVQPFVSCKTKDGLPFDIRIHVQKNGLGEWDTTLIYPRIGTKDGIVSNVSSGGYTGKLDKFLEREFGLESYDIKKALEHFALHFPKNFDDIYISSLDELGIDIGIDENKKIWIYEVNWRPGYGNRGFDAARNIIPYAAHLALQNKKGV